MKQLFEELAEDGTATDSESPFNIITSLNEVLKSDKVGVTNIKYIQTNLSAWFSFNQSRPSEAREALVAQFSNLTCFDAYSRSYG